jgi:hypothetical protein
MLQSSAGTVPVRKLELKILRSPPPTRDCITGMQCIYELSAYKHKEPCALP